MGTRRALLVAPVYDGKWLPSLSGSRTLAKRLVPLLENAGGYDVQVLDGIVGQTKLRESMGEFFDSDGELLFYYYGHGCVRPPNTGVFATSDAEIRNEGVSMRELSDWAKASQSREVIAIIDCCHAGAAVSVTPAVISTEASSGFSDQPGRAILAACEAHQQGWEVQDQDQETLGVFSHHILEGLAGAARLRGSSNVRASVLGAHVTEVFSSWRQSPIHSNCETGGRHCVITSGFAEEPRRPDQAFGGPLYVGLPFKPAEAFFGRSAEIDFLRSMLVGGKKPIAVSATVEGLGGIGKTELVLQLMNDPSIASSFATIIWLDGAGPLAPQWQEVGIQLKLKNLPKKHTDLLDRVVSALHRRGNTLVVLDNASEWEPVKHLIPPTLPLLVTTRTRGFGGASFRHTDLGVLSDDAARDFLENSVPGIAGNPALPRLVELLEGHALAIELAGHYIRDFCTPQEYVDKLIKRQLETPKSVVSKTHYQATVDGCLEITWESLRSDDARLLWKKAALFAPTSAHRDLLRTSFVGGGEDTELKWVLRELEHMQPTEFGDGGIGDILGRPESFEDAYAELRGCHVLARVEGHNGERWAMHRLVRDFGRSRLRQGEIHLHAMCMADWLRNPIFPIGPEISHFVAAILDSARARTPAMLDALFLGRRRYQRAFDREIAHRISPQLLSGDGFGTEYLIQFIRDELSDPKALTLILAGLSDLNEDVRAQAIRLIESIGPIPELLDGLGAALNDPDREVRELAGKTLANYGGERTVEILVEALTAEKPSARRTAVHALTLIGSKGNDALVVALGNDDRETRTQAAISLCEQGRTEGVDIALSSLSEMFGSDLNRCIRALGATRDSRSLPALCKAAEQEDTRWTAIEALRGFPADDLEEIVRLLDSATRGVPLEAALVLAEKDIIEGIEWLLQNAEAVPDRDLNRCFLALGPRASELATTELARCAMRTAWGPSVRDEAATILIRRCVDLMREDSATEELAWLAECLMSHKGNQATVKALRTEENTTQVLGVLLAHQDGRVALEAALLLAEHDDKDGLGYLVREVDRCKGDDLARILMALGSRAVGLPVKTLRRCLDVSTGDSRLRESARSRAADLLVQKCLLAIRGKDVQKAETMVATYLKHHATRRVLFEKLREPEQATMPVLEGLLTNDDTRVAAEAALILSEHGIQEASDCLVRVAGGFKGDVLARILLALGLRAAELEVRTLIKCVKTNPPNSEGVLRAATLLGEAKARLAVPTLVKAFKKCHANDTETMKGICEALGQIGGRAAKQFLEQVEKEKAPGTVKEAAAAALHMFVSEDSR